MKNKRLNKMIIKQITENANSTVLKLVEKLIRQEPKEYSKILSSLVTETEKYNLTEKSKYGKWKATPGVYLIYPKKNFKFVYVGETNDLLRRIKGDISSSSIEKRRIVHTFVR